MEVLWAGVAPLGDLEPRFGSVFRLLFGGGYHSEATDWMPEWSIEHQKKIESYWSGKNFKQPFDERNQQDKHYILSMFPYPSGNMHLGHIAIYMTTDVLVRYHRLCGKNVLNPMGWDAFGLPAENAAIEKNIDPKVWTEQNIKHFKSMMQRLNFSFDWDREIRTCNPEYYKWTQLLFLKLYENGLAYRSKEFVNWDPVDQTVLADEQVSKDGLSWRSGAKVEKKLLTQWFIRTTRFCESLIEGLDDLVEGDAKIVAAAQREWIGKCDGTTFDFEVVENESDLKVDLMTVWTKNPEHLYHVKYVAVLPTSKWNDVAGVSRCLAYKLRNPITREVIPVYSTEVPEYPEGSNCVMGVPELSEKDKSFAESVGLQYTPSVEIITDEEELAVRRRKVCEEARKLGVGGHRVSSHLHDWLISRQRRWGTPIPIVHCEKCGPQPVREIDLPVLVPETPRSGKEESGQVSSTDWSSTTCPKCGGAAVRETDTMDTFVDSSWYYLRYIDPHNVNAPFDLEKVKNIMPVDLYIGGEEHATLHLYFARFMNHFLHSVGMVPSKEPFKNLLLQTVIRGKTFQLSNGEYVSEKDLEMYDSIARHKITKEILAPDWQKMSKSKKNGVDAEALLNDFGSDVVRLGVTFCCGTKRAQNWNEGDIKGAIMFLKRNWVLTTRFIQARADASVRPMNEAVVESEDKQLREVRNYVIYFVNYSLSGAGNVGMAVRKLMSLTNRLTKISNDTLAFGQELEKCLADYIILMAPFVPCQANELWRGFTSAQNRISTTGKIRWDKSVFEQSWPQVDPGYVPASRLEKGTIKSRYLQDKLKKKSEKKTASAEN